MREIVFEKKSCLNGIHALKSSLEFYELLERFCLTPAHFEMFLIGSLFPIKKERFTILRKKIFNLVYHFFFTSV